MQPTLHIDSFLALKGEHRSACLMLHGFPAAGYSNTPYEKNKDIGQYIAEHAPIDVHIPHYRGLGKSNGDFSFMDSITDSHELVGDLIQNKKYKNVHLIGHSWGGTVAMNLLKLSGENIGKVILLSPFSTIPESQILKPLLQRVSEDVPISYRTGSIEGAVDELMEIKKDHNPKDIAGSLDRNDIFVIQSKEDDEVPVQSTRDFVECFRKKPFYMEFDSEHKFSRNRQALKSLILELLLTDNMQFQN